MGGGGRRSLGSFFEWEREHLNQIIKPILNGYTFIGELARQRKPDLVVLDADLPEMKGFEVCSVIRSLVDVPIVMIGFGDTTTDLVWALESGADLYVTKPLYEKTPVARANALLKRCFDVYRPERLALAPRHETREKWSSALQSLISQALRDFGHISLHRMLNGEPPL